MRNVCGDGEGKDWKNRDAEESKRQSHYNVTIASLRYYVLLLILIRATNSN